MVRRNKLKRFKTRLNWELNSNEDKLIAPFSLNSYFEIFFNLEISKFVAGITAILMNDKNSICLYNREIGTDKHIDKLMDECENIYKDNEMKKTLQEIDMNIFNWCNLLSEEVD